MSICPVPELVAELAAGRMVILVDEEDRENEGDLVLAAEHVTPEAINFMARHARGLICLTLTRERCERLQLPPMASRNGTKVFYVTANPAQIDPVAATALGYIRKPFSESAIRAAAHLAAMPTPPRDADHAEIRLF